MSYTMTHLEVAYRLLDRYSWISRQGDFLIGAVAPDAVHFRDDYSPGLKERSHLWNCGPKWGITLESEKWKRNVQRFWEAHQHDDNRDFIAGYCVHILMDWLNDLMIWSPFRKENIKGDDVEGIYHIYGNEAAGSDLWLYQNSADSRTIMTLLSEGRACSVKGCITQEDIEKQKRYILSEQYAGKKVQNIDNYRYCTEKALRGFLDDCVVILGEMLFLTGK